MKLREFFYALGWKPQVREYPFEIETWSLAKEGDVQYARWQHPRGRRGRTDPAVSYRSLQADIDSLRQFLKPGDAAIDIGAHTGDTTVPMALAVGSQGLVFGLEPNKYAFKILLANSALNRKQTNIVPLMFAATPEDGDFEFEYSDAGFCNGGLHEGIHPWVHAHFFKLKVQGKNLVEYLRREYPDDLRRIRYIKTDTEGFDPPVVRSLLPLIEAHRPYLKCEIYKHLAGEKREAFLKDLQSWGYRVHKWDGPEQYAGEVLNAGDMSKWPHYDIFAVPIKA